MSSTSTYPPGADRSARIGRLALWTGRILVALLFLASGGAKIFGVADMVEGFEAIGFGQWFRYFTGAVEWLGAALLLWPAASPFGALIVVGISIGAFFAQLYAMHGDVIHTLVLLAIGLALLWAQRRRLVTTFGFARWPLV
jgi:uncharacterized membrane protein YphA (DoxX/SURF4 family)